MCCISVRVNGFQRDSSHQRRETLSAPTIFFFFFAVFHIMLSIFIKYTLKKKKDFSDNDKRKQRLLSDVLEGLLIGHSA